MKKIIVTFSVLFYTSAINYAQSRTEIGVHADAMHMGVLSKSGYTGNPSYNLDNMALGFGGYLNHYVKPFFGLSVGLQFVFSQDGTVKYPFNGNIGQQFQYTYDYAAVRVPIGFTGDIFKLFYYHAGVNLHIDQSKINNKKNDNLMNGFGIHGEFGIRIVLLDLVALRVGLTAQGDNLMSFNQSSNYIYDVGARVRLGLRL